jgi:pseudouridine-5'-phosphate glycosidase
MRDKAAGLPLVIAPEVAAALAERHPVVALESTIVSHGMPYPDNLAMAQTVERIVHDHGAVPATIAVIAGEFRIGLDAAALKAIAADRQAAKASSRDLAIMAVQKRNAGTTVSATMLLAALAGIEVFATGGIGGVHRGAEQTFDISADLIELGRTPVAVVCAGAKSILDIPKTLEVLETQRVPVIGVGTSDFPAFFTRSSGCKTDLRLDTAAEIAAAIKLHRQLGSGSGLLPGCGDDRHNHRRCPSGSRAARHCGQGRDALPAGPHQQADRRRKPEGQYRTGEEQCCTGGADCGRAGEAGLIDPASARQHFGGSAANLALPI